MRVISLFSHYYVRARVHYLKMCHGGLAIHPSFTLRFRHLLDGIAEGGARHLLGVLAKEIAQQVHAASLAHLAQHPARGLLHQVVRVVQVFLSIAQAPGWIALL